MGKCNCTPLVIENHAVHKINCSTMTAQPDNTIDSEVEEILYAFSNYWREGAHDQMPPGDYLTPSQAAHTITNLIAQEANKAYGRGYNTGWQKANRKHKRVWRQINDLSTIDGIGELEGEAQ